MRYQTDLSLPMEMQFYFNCGEWLRAETVIDLGTGNGYYLRKLSGYFPNKRYVGVDLDPNFIVTAKAEARSGGDGCHAPPADFIVSDALQVAGSYDAAIARLLIQHLPCLNDFLENLGRVVKPGGTLIVIESRDEERRFAPPVPSLSRFFEALRQNRSQAGCNRDAGRILPELASRCGFEVLRSSVLVVPSTLPHIKDLFLRTYLVAFDVVRLNFGLDVDYQTLVDDLKAWRADPHSYTQLGVHMACYRRR
jgi:SAM-dependent methyltransferase